MKVTQRQRRLLKKFRDTIQARQVRRLIARGWTHNPQAGWEANQYGQGWELNGVTCNYAFFSGQLEYAIRIQNAIDRQNKKDFEAAIPEMLVLKGWTMTGPNHDVWSRPNWEKKDGDCNRTMKQAYKIQLKLDACSKAQE